MSVMTILDSLFIGPLKLFFEIVFVIMERVVGSPGLSIIALSLVINILMLPLHKRADMLQEQSRDKEAMLRDGVAHIKKTFSGDERMMILQTYYRQNDYKPTNVLNGSISLLLEIPFFMAAYQLLSNMAALEGASLGPIGNLGTPDGILVVGTIVINVLPILMTLINILSGAIYSKGFPLKTKLQMYGLALFFLVFLYNSPSGLVFYWTLNNLFSLVKNLYRKSDRFQKLGKLLLQGLGIVVLVFGLFLYNPDSYKRKLVVIAIGVVLLLPLFIKLLKGKITLPKFSLKGTPNQKLFFLGCLFITILTGVLIPSTYISASPQEYVYTSYYHNPLLYILRSTLLASGVFLIWLQVFYRLAAAKAKVVFDKVIWILCGVMLVNYMFFGRNLGTMYSNLQFAERLVFSKTESAINLLVLFALIPILYFVVRKWPQATTLILLTGSIALGGMSAINIFSANKELQNIKNISLSSEENQPTFRLSKDGKNVVVIMLDRSVGQLVPYLINEKPELKEQFDGFVYYQNTISFGKYTVFGSPALVGGYEYTPVEINKRSDEALVDKHNEALKVMPVIFSENGYETTVMDPVYANYQWIPDLSIYDEYPEINAYLTNGVFIDQAQIQAEIDSNNRNFFCFSLMKCAPVTFQGSLYSSGTYNQAYSPSSVYAGQVTSGISKGEGFSPMFMDEYSILCNMDTMTQITDETVNTYMFIDNNTTHEPVLLQEPDYIPAVSVNNKDYDANNTDRFTVDGVTLNIDTIYQMSHYHANMAALLKLGEWFDYLRENGVYDNTRIIIASDHGRQLGAIEELIYNDSNGPVDVSDYNALLMVKDFGSSGFSISNEFMTNADVPTLSIQGLIEDATNPFTGKLINNEEKYLHNQLICRSEVWGVVNNQGNTFNACYWASVKDDLWDPDSWKFSTKETILKEHVLP